MLLVKIDGYVRIGSLICHIGRGIRFSAATPAAAISDSTSKVSRRGEMRVYFIEE